MQLVHDVAQWRAYCERQRVSGERIGLVPTMGALHAGHTALFDAAKARGDHVVATLFVNPRQFNDADDLTHYPRSREQDHELASDHGVDCLVEPSLADMWPDYPNATATTVSVHGIGENYEGASRPGHFDGVTSVVAKLFTITGPCRAYFGEKDFQQLAMVRQMVRDLSFDVDVVGCPIVRDDDGLALSSRNARLGPVGRQRALGLSRVLGDIGSSAAKASTLRSRLRASLAHAQLDVVYADVVNPVTFEPSRDDEGGQARALIAANVDGVRLIDNGTVTLEREER
jgi:pantoate--beta-alanine ligase